MMTVQDLLDQIEELSHNRYVDWSRVVVTIGDGDGYVDRVVFGHGVNADPGTVSVDRLRLVRA